jgi:hypothetical protein
MAKLERAVENTRCRRCLFGFFTLIQLLDGPERYGALIFFDTMPSGGGTSRPRAFERFSHGTTRRQLAYTGSMIR